MVAIAVLASSCGGGKGPCASLCEEIKPKLVEELPNISPENVLCTKAPWTKADTCGECLDVLADLYDVAVSDESELCSRHF